MTVLTVVTIERLSLHHSRLATQSLRELNGLPGLGMVQKTKQNKTKQPDSEVKEGQCVACPTLEADFKTKLDVKTALASLSEPRPENSERPFQPECRHVTTPVISLQRCVVNLTKHPIPKTEGEQPEAVSVTDFHRVSLAD
eukprot:1108499-Rhodomonas_salina.1